MAIPTNVAFPSFLGTHEYAFVPTTGVDFPAGVCRAIFLSHNASTTVTVIIANGDSVVIGVNGTAYLPLRVKQVSVNAGAVSVVALY